MNCSVLIADDEPLARRTLREHLRCLGWQGSIHEAQDGITAISLANGERPDLVFLDIVMPGATGLQVLEHLDYEPKVIFTTAHDQYAVTAFEPGALDYLLKPFARDRLEQVMKRARLALNSTAAPFALRAKESLNHPRKPSTIFVRDGSRIVPIRLLDIERIQGADDYVTIHSSAKEYLVNVRLSDLEVQLGSGTFMRIHRSHIINLEFVVSMEPYDAGRLEVVMKSSVRIVASRTGTKRLRHLAL